MLMGFHQIWEPVFWDLNGVYSTRGRRVNTNGGDLQLPLMGGLDSKIGGTGKRVSEMMTPERKTLDMKKSLEKW
jgi:hypothetical protein